MRVGGMVRRWDCGDCGEAVVVGVGKPTSTRPSSRPTRRQVSHVDGFSHSVPGPVGMLRRASAPSAPSSTLSDSVAVLGVVVVVVVASESRDTPNPLINLRRPCAPASLNIPGNAYVVKFPVASSSPSRRAARRGTSHWLYQVMLSGGFVVVVVFFCPFNDTSPPPPPPLPSALFSASFSFSSLNALPSSATNALPALGESVRSPATVLTRTWITVVPLTPWARYPPYTSPAETWLLVEEDGEEVGGPVGAVGDGGVVEERVEEVFEGFLERGDAGRWGGVVV
ncbi:hypothetical protein DFH27DRAFT_225830 [Peziza echinospora]|nr:hypothetical protein DFH27DRAFT_225830 [Peziza echinospora]